jgi:hypothetical protein
MFLTHPLIGSGTASTIDWSFPVSTHDIYVRHLAEYGLLGAAFYPALILIAVHGLWNRDRTMALAAGAFILLWGVFSHNVLEDWSNLVAIAFMLAAGSTAGAPCESRM